MNTAILSTELSGDPLGRNYAGMTDRQAANDLNELRYPVATRVTYITLAADLDLDVVRRLIATIDAVSVSDAVVREMQSWLRSDAGVDVGNAKVRAMLDAFAANESLLLTASDAAAIQALANDKASRAQQLGLGAVKVGHIQQARA